VVDPLHHSHDGAALQVPQVARAWHCSGVTTLHVVKVPASFSSQTQFPSGSYQMA